MEPLEGGQLERVNSELTSTSSGSGISSVFSSEDFGSLNSTSCDISSLSSGSGEIPEITVNRLVDVPPLIIAVGSNEEEALAEAVVMENKCVGRSNKGVISWGQTSVIGRRKEMEDAVAVIQGFMSGKCDHVGGCTAPGSRSSGDIAPVHFFGVYDGHGGSQGQAAVAGVPAAVGGGRSSGGGGRWSEFRWWWPELRWRQAVAGAPVAVGGGRSSGGGARSSGGGGRWSERRWLWAVVGAYMWL